MVRDNEALRKREYASAHSLYELSNYIIIRDRPRSGCEMHITGGSLNLISRQFSRETKFLSLRSRSAIKCAGILRIWKYDLIKG